MNRPARICVIGSANVDMTFRTPRMPAGGETLAGRSVHVGMGGKGANQAVAAARLGAAVTFVSRVGRDSFGDDAIRAYAADEIDTSFVGRDADRPTGTAAIIVDDAAENCIIYVAGANAALTPQDVRDARAAIERADAVLCQFETPIDATIEAFRIARAAHVRTVLTPAPVVELPDELLELCDLCVPNRAEAEFLAGRAVHDETDALAAAEVLRDRGIGSVVVTMGGRGAVVLDDAGSARVAALSVRAVDTTGAGDSFTAALGVWLAEGLSLAPAARRAAAVAAITVTRPGAQASFPRRAEVETRLISD